MTRQCPQPPMGPPTPICPTRPVSTRPPRWQTVAFEINNGMADVFSTRRCVTTPFFARKRCQGQKNGADLPPLGIASVTALRHQKMPVACAKSFERLSCPRLYMHRCIARPDRLHPRPRARRPRGKPDRRYQL